MADNGHDFITTFFSHYGAMKYKKKCDEYHIKAKLMPVPRNLSSSCGTCVGSDRLAENVLSDQIIFFFLLKLKNMKSSAYLTIFSIFQSL